MSFQRFKKAFHPATPKHTLRITLCIFLLRSHHATQLCFDSRHVKRKDAPSTDLTTQSLLHEITYRHWMQRGKNKVDIRAECIGSLGFINFVPSGSLANWPRWRSWICGTDSLRLGPCAGSLVPLQYLVHSFGVWDLWDLPAASKTNSTCPYAFFQKLTFKTCFLNFLELERSTWKKYLWVLHYRTVAGPGFWLQVLYQHDPRNYCRTPLDTT